jgi:hypothetical protein
LTNFDISKNNLKAEGGKALAEALKGNQVMTELNVAENMLIYKADATSEADVDTSGVTALADVIPGMRALLHFDISNNDIRAEGGKALVEAFEGNQVITTLSIARNNLSFNSSGKRDMSGVAALADAIPGMGALLEHSLC